MLYVSPESGHTFSAGREWSKARGSFLRFLCGLQERGQRHLAVNWDAMRLPFCLARTFPVVWVLAQMSPFQSALLPIALCNVSPTPALSSLIDMLPGFISFCLYLSLHDIISPVTTQAACALGWDPGWHGALDGGGWEQPRAFVQTQTSIAITGTKQSGVGR